MNRARWRIVEKIRAVAVSTVSRRRLTANHRWMKHGQRGAHIYMSGDAPVPKRTVMLRTMAFFVVVVMLSLDLGFSALSLIPCFVLVCCSSADFTHLRTYSLSQICKGQRARCKCPCDGSSVFCTSGVIGWRILSVAIAFGQPAANFLSRAKIFVPSVPG